MPEKNGLVECWWTFVEQAVDIRLMEAIVLMTELTMDVDNTPFFQNAL